MPATFSLPRDGEPRIYIIHENDEWVVPLHAAMRELELPYADLFIDRAHIEIAGTPPPGVYYNRMSASSHTRGHRYAAELTGVLLRWLEAHDRTIANGSRSLALELSKAAQYAALGRCGIRTPRSIVAAGDDQVIEAAAFFSGGPFIIKHNRGGKGLGVQLIRDVATLRALLASGTYEAPIDGLTLLQDYIAAPEPFITRMEFVGGKFIYAVRVNTSDGFELCPADACAPTAAVCAPGETAPDKFQIIEGFTHPLTAQCEAFMVAHDIAVSGIEYIIDAAGTPYVYDVNCNTNYNPAAEAKAGKSGMRAIALYMGELLGREYAPRGRFIGTHAANLAS